MMRGDTGAARLIAKLVAFAVLTTIVSPATARKTTEAKKPRPVGNLAAQFGEDSYPPAAARAGEHGRVSVELAIDTAGHVTDCIVTASSQSTSLDSKTCEIGRTLAFDPATDRQGKVVAGTFPLKVNWILPVYVSTMTSIDVTDPANYPPAVTETEVVIGTNGAIESCKVIEHKPSFIPDPCTAFPLGQNVGPGFVRNGKSVKAIQRQRWDTSTRFVDP